MVDWQAFFFAEGEHWPERLLARARRRYGDTPDAEAAYNYALEKVSVDDWQRLREGFKGRGSPDGFLGITFVNLLEEYAVRKYGRRRPPAWVQRLGSLWKRVYELLCLRRQMPESIVATLGGLPGVDDQEIRTAIRQVKGRIPDCGAWIGEDATGDELPVAVATEQAQPPAALEESELATLLGALRSMMAGQDEGEVRSVHDTGAMDQSAMDTSALAPADMSGIDLAAMRAALDFSDQERLLLKLVFREGLPVAQAALLLRLHEQKTRRLLKKLLLRLREVLAPLGFSAGASS